MATEQELQDQITALQSEVENLNTERDLLKASIVDKDAARDVQLKVAADTVAAAEDESNKLSAKVVSLEADLAEAKKAAKSKKAAPAAEGVVLAGVPHDIVRQERAADLVSAHRARFVEDDDICLVVKKS